jgi:hypothetical protein
MLHRLRRSYLGSGSASWGCVGSQASASAPRGPKAAAPCRNACRRSTCSSARRRRRPAQIRADLRRGRRNLDRAGTYGARPPPACAQRRGGRRLSFLALANLPDAESKCGDIPAAVRRVDQVLRMADEHGRRETSPAGAAAVVLASSPTTALAAALGQGAEVAGKAAALKASGSWSLRSPRAGVSASPVGVTVPRYRVWSIS